jgi:hypothetical protein
MHSRVLADIVVLAHLLWILFLLGGAYVGRINPVAMVLHGAGLVFAVAARHSAGTALSPALRHGSGKNKVPRVIIRARS